MRDLTFMALYEETYFCSFFFMMIIAAPATVARPRMAKRGVDSPVDGFLMEELLEELEAGLEEDSGLEDSGVEDSGSEVSGAEDSG